jgi:hypothetical protein
VGSLVVFDNWPDAGVSANDYLYEYLDDKPRHYGSLAYEPYVVHDASVRSALLREKVKRFSVSAKDMRTKDLSHMYIGDGVYGVWIRVDALTHQRDSIMAASWTKRNPRFWRVERKGPIWTARRERFVSMS